MNFCSYENPKEPICRYSAYPYIFSYHLDGTIQLINVNTEEDSKYLFFFCEFWMIYRIMFQSVGHGFSE